MPHGGNTLRRALPRSSTSYSFGTIRSDGKAPNRGHWRWRSKCAGTRGVLEGIGPRLGEIIFLISSVSQSGRMVRGASSQRGARMHAMESRERISARPARLRSRSAIATEPQGPRSRTRDGERRGGIRPNDDAGMGESPRSAQ